MYMYMFWNLNCKPLMKAYQYVKLSLEIFRMVKMFSLGFYSVTVTGLPLLCVWLFDYLRIGLWLMVQ